MKFYDTVRLAEKLLRLNKLDSIDYTLFRLLIVYGARFEDDHANLFSHQQPFVRFCRTELYAALFKLESYGLIEINATRFAVLNALKATGLDVETGTGGRTKYNRCQQGYPKTHWLDAACVGKSGENVFAQPDMQVLKAKAMGRGSRQKCRVDKYGFPRTTAKKQKRVQGFQTGDMVKAIVPAGKKVGTYVGRVAIRTRGYFNIKTDKETVNDIHAKFCTILQQVDGYAY